MFLQLAPSHEILDHRPADDRYGHVVDAGRWQCAFDVEHLFQVEVDRLEGPMWSDRPVEASDRDGGLSTSVEGQLGGPDGYRWQVGSRLGRELSAAEGTAGELDEAASQQGPGRWGVLRNPDVRCWGEDRFGVDTGQGGHQLTAFLAVDCGVVDLEAQCCLAPGSVEARK
jgi:hypothetical protein